MKRMLLLMPIASLLVVAGMRAWAGEPEPTDQQQADRYAVPEGGVAELLKLIGELSQVRPDTAKEDIEHRSKFRPALQQAAEKILKLEKDQNSVACRVAKFILLANRVHAIAQGGPQQRRQTVADVKAYLAEKVQQGQARQAANLAKLAATTLQQMGEYELAADANKRFAEVIADSEDATLSSLARTMEATARRLLEMSKQIQREGLKIEIPPKGTLVPLDLEGKTNQNLNDLSGPGDFEGNGLAELPRGDQTCGGVKFRIGQELIQLAGTNLPNAPAKVEGIPVDRKVARLYVLHATQWSSATGVKDGTVIGEYNVHYEDDSTASMPVAFGDDVRDWWNNDQGKPTTRGKVVWTGSNIATDRNNVTLRLYLGMWENPHPDKKVTSVDYLSTNDTVCAPFCVAMTVEEPAD